MLHQELCHPREPGPHKVILHGSSRPGPCRHEKSTAGGEAQPCTLLFLKALARLERLQGGTDATRQGDPLRRVKEKHRVAWGAEGECWLHRSYLSFPEDVDTFSRQAHVHHSTQEGETSRHTLTYLHKHSEGFWKEARPWLLTRSLHATEDLSHVCVSQDNQIERLPPNKCALSRPEGRFYVSLSPSDGHAEGQIWRRACSRLLRSFVQLPIGVTMATLSACLCLALQMRNRQSVLISNTHCQRVMTSQQSQGEMKLLKHHSGLSANQIHLCCFQ